MNARNPEYDADRLLDDLQDGLTYDDFAALYGMDVVEADSAVRDLKSRGYDIERVEAPTADGDLRMWVRADAFDALEE